MNIVYADAFNRTLNAIVGTTLWAQFTGNKTAFLFPQLYKGKKTKNKQGNILGLNYTGPNALREHQEAAVNYIFCLYGFSELANAESVLYYMLFVFCRLAKTKEHWNFGATQITKKRVMQKGLRMHFLDLKISLECHNTYYHRLCLCLLSDII